MAKTCLRCGTELGFLRRFKSHYCPTCEEQVGEDQAEAVEAFRATLDRVWKRELAPDRGRAALADLRLRAGSKVKDLPGVEEAAFKAFAGDVLDDDVLSVDEETRLFSTASVMDVDNEAMQTRFPDIWDCLIIARINDGRLAELREVPVILKRGEVGHVLVEGASLMKRVAIREYQGVYSGFSFAIVRGVRYHVGGVRGRSMTVAHRLVPDDTGALVVTSARTVFVGASRAADIARAKLLRVEVFDNGLVISSSNRKNSLHFKLPHSEVVAATINAAAQKGLA